MPPWLVGLPLLLAAAAPGAAADIAATAPLPAHLSPPPPILREARYRMSAAVRPLRVFWIRADDVGGARIVWRGAADGRRGYELLIGSDPLRAPRKINRWGWELEATGPEGATVVGLMRKTDEESLDEAARELGSEGQRGYFFKTIQARIAGNEVHAESALWRSPRDYTYRELDALLERVGSQPAQPMRVRDARVAEDVYPGFLFAVTSLVDEAVDAAVASGPERRLLANRKATFTFNASLYDLTLVSSQWLESATYAGQRHQRLVKLRFEHFNREKRSRERFVLVCATDGPLARVPVYVEYQPKWWFKAEGVLDGEAFP